MPDEEQGVIQPDNDTTVDNTPIDEEEYEENEEETQETEENESKNKIFQTRVFHEQNNEIYGAEVILFDDKEEIERILITDEIKLESFNALINNMEEAYVPYSQKDLANLEILKKVASNQLDTSSDEYKLMTWSKLHEKGDLKSILENNLQVSESEERSYNEGERVIINATHVDGLNSGDFARYDHKHSDYLNVSHLNTFATTTNAGHAQIVDRLDEDSLSDGKVLSARQGKVLNDKLTNLSNKFDNSWTQTRKIGEYITYKVNTHLGLIVCTYKRKNYKGFQSSTGAKLLHEKKIDSRYCPSSNVVTPILRGDIVLYYTKDGSVYINSLTRQSSIDIDVQTMWSYR